MNSGSKWVIKAHYFLKLAIIYGITIFFGWYCIRPYHEVVSLTNLTKTTRTELEADQVIKVIAGLPVRVVIPASAIDIPVDPGYYNPDTDTWTLSGYRAQFDMSSMLANNTGGDSFIYGHNNDFVFGSLRHTTPQIGAIAYVYTANGHIFQYSFSQVYSIGPTDTSVLFAGGPPTLTIQTCTGSLNEWRTMYIFNFDKVLT
jgi:sortase (surface protein transpeptidase)